MENETLTRPEAPAAGHWDEHIEAIIPSDVVSIMKAPAASYDTSDNHNFEWPSVGAEKRKRRFLHHN